MATTTTKVIGPPGCGKTHYMLNRIEKACDTCFPKDIGVVSYTVASVAEAKKRMQDKLGVDLDEIKNVRTIHAHCFNLLGMKKENVMESAKNVRMFNEQHPAYAISSGLKITEEDAEPVDRETKHSDSVHGQMQVLRSKMVHTDQWPDACQEMHGIWSSFMEDNDLLDFNGMLEECVRRDLSPSIKLLYVDEAQDLPKLQIKLIEQWGQQCSEIAWHGDGNQAILRFAGSDPDNFINLVANNTVFLDQSYRLSPAILEKSVEIISQAHIKEMVDFNPTDKYGPGEVVACRQPDLTLPGSHMILCRCNFQTQRFIAALRDANIPFANAYRKEDIGWNPLELDGAKSIRAYLKLYKGEELGIKDLKQLVKNCVAKKCLSRGAKSWIERLPPTDRQTYALYSLKPMGFLDDFLNRRVPIRECFRIKSRNSDLIFHLSEHDPDQLFRPPLVTVGTIHSVKGGEADHVWIDPGITGKIKNAIDKEPDAWDDECRVAYVGVTRARKTVGIVNSKSYRNPIL